MKDETVKMIVAIAALALLESVAMATNHDGAFFMPVVAAISGIAGYQVKAAQIKD